MGTWEELDHTADLAVRVRADDLTDLFVTSAEAMFALAAEPEDAELGDAVHLQLEAIDREALLVDWLNELLYVHERDGVVIRGITFECLTPTRLEAWVRGVPVKRYLANIKAATFHALDIQRGEEGLSTEIVFDI